jgi:hypothetical protein
MLLAIAPLSLSLSLSLWVSSEFHRTKKTRRRWKSTSNEEVGFVCAPFKFRVSGKGGGWAGYFILMITAGSGS